VIRQTFPPPVSLRYTAVMTDSPSRFDDLERWRRRAAEMRKIADGMAHLPRAQASLLETAKEYDRRAARAENTAYMGDMAMLSEAVGAIIFVALIGSHIGMWMWCRR
jgi:hypothetical protein